jgi:hypothetical protein
MPQYTDVTLPYAVLGVGSVWVDSRSTFTATSLGKESDPSSDRQQHFHDQLLRLREYIGSNRLPIFVRWPGVGSKRMDKGCIGHAVTAGFLTPPTDAAEGYVTHVEIAGI